MEVYAILLHIYIMQDTWRRPETLRCMGLVPHVYQALSYFHTLWPGLVKGRADLRRRRRPRCTQETPVQQVRGRQDVFAALRHHHSLQRSQDEQDSSPIYSLKRQHHLLGIAAHE